MLTRDPMEAAKAIAEDRLTDEANRALKAKDIIVERTLAGRPMDRLCLGTALNCLMADGDDTPLARHQTEAALRSGATVTTRLGSYRVAPSQVVPGWTAIPKEQP